jgi:hypothetical protein
MAVRDPEIDLLALGHGQARWVLSTLGLHAGEDEPTFDSYIKSLRRDGVPFAPKELGVGAGHNLTYRYVHLMELAVALALRTQGILSRDIVGLLAHYRTTLRPFYRQAWLERESGLGAPREVIINSDTRSTRRISGTYLDLMLTYSERGMLHAPRPTLLDPVQALDYYMAYHESVYPRPPLPVSQYAQNIVALSKHAPEIKRGRRS